MLDGCERGGVGYGPHCSRYLWLVGAPQPVDVSKIGGGLAGVTAPIHYSRFSRPDLVVYTSPFEPLSYVLGPLVVESPFLGRCGRYFVRFPSTTIALYLY